MEMPTKITIILPLDLDFDIKDDPISRINSRITQAKRTPDSRALEKRFSETNFNLREKISFGVSEFKELVSDINSDFDSDFDSDFGSDSKISDSIPKSITIESLEILKEFRRYLVCLFKGYTETKMDQETRFLDSDLSVISDQSLRFEVYTEYPKEDLRTLKKKLEDIKEDLGLPLIIVEVVDLRNLEFL